MGAIEPIRLRPAPPALLSDVHRTITSNMEQGVLVHDGQMILVANERLAQVLSCPPEIARAGVCLGDFIAWGLERGDYGGADEDELTAAAMQARIAARQDYEQIRHLPDGRSIRIDSRFHGRHAVVTYTDITRAERRERIIRTTFDAMAQGILIHDETRVVAHNDRFTDMLGLPEGLVRVGQDWRRIVDFRHARGDYGDDGHECVMQAHDEAVATGNHTSYQTSLGRRLHCEVRSADDLMIVTYTDVTEAREREERLARSEREVRRLAECDPLTGLLNRAAFDTALRERLAAGGAFVLLLVDLDGFKPVNDTHGHPAGDALLRAVSQRFVELAGEHGYVARIGGDEFAVIAGGGPREAALLASDLREAASRAVRYEGISLRAGASVGYAFAQPGLDAAGLLNRADLALYAAKRDGRGCERTFDPEMAARVTERRTLEADLRGALGSNQIVLHYQVQRDLASEADVGYEALMRWEHPARGLVGPDRFIPIAEETGLIVELGRFALAQAAQDFASLDDTTRVAVNVSPVQFERSDLVADVRAALEASGLHPSRLEIEITEELLIADTEKTLATLESLKGLGVSLSLDDFGSGYSSLAYLTRFPFSKIKIDRCFVDRMLLDERSGSLVSSILALAASLGMRVTAEGVENAQQLATLIAGRCDEVQGYLLGRPVPFSELTLSG